MELKTNSKLNSKRARKRAQEKERRGEKDDLTLNIELEEEKKACFEEETRFRATVENMAKVRS